jgi:hypothetical protein
MILYHINIGWPVLDNSSKILMENSKIKPMNDEAKKAGKKNLLFTKPLSKNTYEIYLCEIKPDSNGLSKVAFINQKFNDLSGMGINIKYTQKNLPYLILFKKMTKGEYFCSLEPASSFENRSSQRKNKNLGMLKPSEKVTNKLEFEILASNKEIDNYITNNKLNN